MHMDPIAARRTNAGSPVVHGIHVLLWSIDQLLQRPNAGSIGRIKCNWSHFVRVGDTVELLVESETAARLRAQISVGGEAVASLTVFFSARAPHTPRLTGDHSIQSPETPCEPCLDQLKGQSGAVGFATPPEEAAALFPSATSAMGADRVAGFLTLSRLVGMICPGLHSIFARLDIALTEGTAGDFIAYQVTEVDPRFRYVIQSIEGAGLSGEVEAFARNPPAEQPGIDELSKMVSPGEFAGSVALVIGGSRGLGEVTAKLLALGSARVVISYSQGREDADRVAASIRGADGNCDVIHYDARDVSSDQIADLASRFSHVYYFATGSIAQSRVKPFDNARFQEFCDFYVRGFAHLCSCLRPAAGTAVKVFYPSSVYVSPGECPEGLGEYAVAKAAGEALCGALGRSCPQIEMFSRRLPRMKTDQTSSFLSDESYSSSAEVMLAAIREMHQN